MILVQNDDIMFGIETRLVEVSPTNEDLAIDFGPSFLRVVSFDPAQKAIMLEELELEDNSTNVSEMCIFYSSYYQGDPDVIHAGCLGIRNGLPTNPFVQ